MHWFRLRQRWGSYLALVALAFQLALTFGHVHLDRSAPTSADAFTVASTDAWSDANSRPADPAGRDHRPDDRCPICTLIHLAQALITGRAAILALAGCLPSACQPSRRSRSTSPNLNARSLRRAHLPPPDIDLVPARRRASAVRADTRAATLRRDASILRADGSFPSGIGGCHVYPYQAFASSEQFGARWRFASPALPRRRRRPLPPETPPTTTPPASEPPAPQPPQTTPEAPQTAPATPQTVPRRRRASRSRRHGDGAAAPARCARRGRRAPRPGDDTAAPATTPTPTATPGASTAGQPAATSPFNQPPASLTTITSNQIQASPAQSFGNLFFTLPGATSAGLAPGASRPVLRGLDDFRVRVQENGIGSMDVSDLGQDHGVPIDPLSIQKIEIFRGPEALRYGSQAVGGVVEAINNRIPDRGAARRLANANPGRHDHGRPRSRRRRPVRRRHAQRRDPCRLLRPPRQRLFHPELSLSFPAPIRRRRSTASSRTPACIPRARRSAAPTCSTAAMSAPRSSRFTSVYRIPTMEGAADQRAHRPRSRPSSPARASFARSPRPSTSCASGLGAVEYHHDELGFDDVGLDGDARARSTTTRRRPRPRSSSCRWSRRSAP